LGAPTGLRLAQKRPELVRGIITQNGNAYMEGIGPAWDPLRAWWKAGKNSEAYGKTANTLLDNLFTLENTKKEYIDTVPDELRERFDPYTWQIDYHLNLATREGKERQLSLFWDYQNNLARYPDFQDYFRKSRVPILAVWGRHDTYFPQQGAEAFRRDSEAEVRILDGGHFLLETHMEQVAEIMEEWLNKLDK
jgi:pimeloyl-ACP methyl ester carboxylesterase